MNFAVFTHFQQHLIRALAQRDRYPVRKLIFKLVGLGDEVDDFTVELDLAGVFGVDGQNRGRFGIRMNFRPDVSKLVGVEN